MDIGTQKTIINRLKSAIENPDGEVVKRATKIATNRYTDPEELAREQQALFRNQPVIVAQQSQISNPRDYVTADIADVPLIILRDDSGEIQVYVNACRHRGARLLEGESGVCKKLLTCRYHAWSYGMDGSLVAVPHEDVFGSLDRAAFGLHRIPHEVRHGFVWVLIDGAPDQKLDVASFLGSMLDKDFAQFNLSEHHVEQSVSVVKNANWKLVMDAFAEGYHLKSLHRDSLARFFLDMSILDDCSPHVRQVGARRSIKDADINSPDTMNFREDTTVFYNVFPNAVLVFHPLWISQMSLFPQGPDHVQVIHRMLVRKDVDEPVANARLEKSFRHIHEQVFEKEDLAISESIQSTLASGINTHVTLGGLEEGMRIFHAARDRAIASYADS